MKGTKKKREEKISKDHNPFEDWYFWLSLATIDFRFLESEKQEKSESDKAVEKQ
jgi:hypothetical protein